MNLDTVRSRLRSTGSASLAMLGIALLFPIHPVQAQSSWTDPIVIFSTTGYVSYPALVADSEGVVHLLFMFNARKPFTDRSPGELMHARLADGRWSAPIDVLVAPDGGAVNQPSLAIDDEGYLHAVWQTAALSEVYYSRSHVHQAGSARGWSSPVALSEPQSSSPAIAVSPDGWVHVLYSGHGGRVTHRRSGDGGESWLAEVTVADFAPVDSAPDHTRLLVDQNGHLHATWTQFPLPAAWPPLGTWYSRSVDGGETWSDPERITGDSYGQVQMAADAENRLHRVWNSVVALGERRHQWSGDGATTWSSAELVSPTLRGGFTGYPALEFDSLGRLHLVTSVSGQSGKTEDVYHTSWSGTWSAPTFISTGVVGERSVEHPSLAISKGNQLHVAYADDFERIWYTAHSLDAPALATRPLAPPTPEPTPQPAVSPPPPASPTVPQTPIALESSNLTATPDPLGPPLAGLIPGILVLGVIALVRAARRWRQ